MPDPEQFAYGNLILDTLAVTAPVLSMGHDGRIDTNLSVPLSITITDADTTLMKVWGYRGETTKTFTADGTSATFTLTDKPTAEDLGPVTKNGGTPLTKDEDFTYDPATGEVEFTVIPSEGDVIAVTYWKDALTENDVVREAAATSKTLNFPAVTGNVTVGCRFWDNVENQSTVTTLTVYCDLTAPVVVIESISANSLTPPKISKVEGKNTAEVIWSCDEDFVAYKVCVVQTHAAAQNAGSIIPSTAGSTNVSDLTESTVYTHTGTMTTTIKGADLETAGAEGNNIIKIFVKDKSGRWSE